MTPPSRWWTGRGGKGYHVGEFVDELGERGIRPHIARVKGRRTPGLDGRTARSGGYRLSLKIRKRIEESFGWMKRVGGFGKTRFRGVDRVGGHRLQHGPDQPIAPGDMTQTPQGLLPPQSGGNNPPSHKGEIGHAARPKPLRIAIANRFFTA